MFGCVMSPPWAVVERLSPKGVKKKNSRSITWCATLTHDQPAQGVSDSETTPQPREHQLPSDGSPCHAARTLRLRFPMISG